MPGTNAPPPPPAPPADPPAPPADPPAPPADPPAPPADPPAPPADPPAGDAGELAEARREAARYRTEARTQKAELDALKAAQMTEEEKRTARLAELEASNAALTAEGRAARILAATAEVGARLGGPPARLLVRLIDPAAIEFDDAGHPTNVEALAKLVIAELKTSAAAPPPPPLGGSADQGAGGSGPGLTRAAIEAMTPEEVNRRWPEVSAAIARGI